MMGGGTTEESGNGAAGDSVVSVRHADGSISISMPMIAHDAESAARFCEQWVIEAGRFKIKAGRISLADKKFINKARAETVVSNIVLKSIWLQKLPDLVALPIVYIKTYFGFIAKARLEADIVRKASEGKELVLCLLFLEAPADFLETRVSVGLTVYPLETGYEFKGTDHTGTYKNYTDLSKKIVEWGCPDVNEWPLDSREILDGVSEEDLCNTVFPLSIMRQVSAEMKKNDAKFKVMIIYESQIGRFVKEIDADTLKKIGIIE
jgi:hypothetical protein